MPRISAADARLFRRSDALVPFFLLIFFALSSVSFTTSIIETVEHARQHWVQSGPWQRSATRRPWARLAALGG